MRRLRVHFMLDIDGTIYQTMDAKERGWHATVSNTRSVGIEIAHMGAYKPGDNATLAKWYAADELGNVRITIPSEKGDGGVRTPNFVGRPLVNDRIRGEIHGEILEQPDFTPQQYDSLARLIAALHVALPKIELTYPKDASGKLITRNLTDDELKQFRGVLGHYHVQDDKIDPGPAVRWELLMQRARAHIEGRRVPALEPESRTSPRTQSPAGS
jgi:N-acetyl-anhydromuramyl-L-alanine amidase AmpD